MNIREQYKTACRLMRQSIPLAYTPFAHDVIIAAISSQPIHTLYRWRNFDNEMRFLMRECAA